MNKNLVKIITTILLLIGVVVPTGYAAADFSLTTESADLETCPTQFVPFEITVTNTGDSPDTYTVSKSGSASKWAIISPPGFVLQPGDSQMVIAYITPSRLALPGTYSIEVTVSGDAAGAKTIEGSIDVTKCHNVELSSEDRSKDICAGSSEEFDLELENTGKWTETYELSLSGLAASWASLDQELVRLDPGDVVDFALTVSVPEGRTGPSTVTVTAKSVESSASDSLSFTLNAQSCYDFQLAVDSNYYSFCENSEARIPIEIQNTGVSTDTYNLDVSGPVWASLDRTTVRIAGETDETVHLVLTPGYGVKGTTSVEITAESQNSLNSDSSDIDANILSCYGVTMTLEKEDDSLCPGTENSHDVIVSNIGNFTESFSVRARGAPWISFSQNLINLEPGESETLDMIVAPLLNSNPGKYMVSVIAESQGTSKVSDTEVMSINLGTKKSCFGVELTPTIDEIEVVYGEGTLIPVLIENIGSEAVTYNLDISGSGAAYTHLNPATLSLDGNSAGRIYLYVSVPLRTEKQEYEAIIAARDEETGTISSSAAIEINLVEEIREPAEIEDELEELPEETEEEIESLGLWARLKNWWSNLFKAPEEEIEAEELPEEEAIEEVPEELEENITPVEEMPEEIVEENITEELEEIAENATEEEEEIPEEAAEEAEEVENVTEAVLPPSEEEPEVPEIQEREQTFTQNLIDYLVEYWYIAIILVIIIILIIMIIRAGLFEAADVEEILKEEKPKRKKPAKPRKKKKKGPIWQKFKDWLEEEEIEEKKSAPKTKKPSKPKKEEKKSTWKRFKDWLEEE